DRFPEDDRTRWYRTGDLVRLRTDGELDFLGRVDDQLQINGHRVEPDEVARTLETHPEVVKASVVGVGDPPQLAAFVQTIADPLVDDLAGYLADRLPAGMVPTRFVPLEHLPTTTNGKVDRHALLELLATPVGTEDSDSEPRGELETIVGDIVAELLDVPVVGLDDDFLLLGGHSLLAARLVVRLADRFGVEMPLRTVFEHPTVAGIAQEVLSLLVAEISSLSD